jgi:hypothetical protein
MASWTSSGLVNLSLLAGARKSDLSTTSIISITAGIEGSVTGSNWVSRLLAKALAFSESERAIPLGDQGGGRRNRNSHHPFCHPPQWLVFGLRDPSVVLHWSFLHSSWQVTNLCRHLTSVPGDLPLPPQSILQAYCVLNASWNWGPWVATRATLGSRCCQSLHNGDGDVLNARVDSYLIVQCRIEANLIFQVILEVAVKFLKNTQILNFNENPPSRSWVFHTDR